MSLLDKIKKNSTIKETAVLSKSKFFNKKDMIQTSVPAINIALSGSLDGGLTPGLTTIAGPSRHFKTLFSLIMAKAYLDKYPESVLLFYDSEFGTPQAYFSSVGIDLERVLHSPISDVEQLKFDLSQQVAELTHEDKVIILIDSVGNLASKKEVEDALDGKSTVDMSRAKQLKSLFRIVTPSLTIKDIPLVVINHTYKTMELYSKDVVSGGCLIKGTKIQLADGSFKNVEDFIVGDIVKTLDGDKEVTATWDPNTLEDGEPECYELLFEDGYTVTCSPSHKFIVDGDWVEAKDLVIGSDCINITT